MTNEELQAHIKALNDAAARGEIETNIISSHGWERVNQMLTSECYRIKPQPREVWIPRRAWMFPDATVSCVTTEPPDADSLWVKFREVLE